MKLLGAPDERIDYQMYELISVPENRAGTIEQDTEVIYYYRTRTAILNITKVAKENNEIALEGTEFGLYRLACNKHSEEYHDNELIDIENVSKCWKKVKEYTTNNDGIISIQNMEVANEYRLVETRAIEKRALPFGQWKIKFELEKNQETSEIIVKENIISLGRAPDIIKTEDGRLLIENAKLYDMPLTGGKGIQVYYIFGGILISLTLIIVVSKKYRK